MAERRSDVELEEYYKYIRSSEPSAREVFLSMIIGCILFFFIYKYINTPLHYREKEDRYGKVYEKNISIETWSNVGLIINRDKAVSNFHDIHIKTKHSKIVSFNEIEYDDLVRYMKEGCIISFNNKRPPVKINGIYFSFLYWRIE